MASATPTSHGWTLDFRPLHAPGKQRRRVRITAKDLGDGASDASADALAKECERYCRLCESRPADPLHIEHARRIRAITDAQADQLRTKQAPSDSTYRPKRPWTVAEAAAAHPASQRLAKKQPEEHLLYLRHIESFCAFAGVRELGKVTLEQVLRWISHLQAGGVSWSGRVHRMLYLKRACVMGMTQAIPNVLAGMRLDREDRRRLIDVWTLDEMAVGMVVLAEDPRARCVIALGGIVGSRPSEIFRVLCGDILQQDLLAIGEREAKNEASIRTLPLPATIAAWCRDLARGRAPTEPLIATSRGLPFTETTLSQTFKPVLARAIGRELQVKSLRKSFETWTKRAGIPGRDIERYVGHQTALLTAVSGRHYLADTLADELRPTAERLERELQAALVRAAATAKERREQLQHERRELEAKRAKQKDKEAAARVIRKREIKRRWMEKARAKAREHQRAV